MGLERHPDEKRVETNIAVEIELSAEAGRAEPPNVRGKLLRNGHEIGECFVHSAGEISSAPKAQTACSLDHFVLDEDERGKGLGATPSAGDVERGLATGLRAGGA
tara:strand:- start:2546 stop:2860 length:315 start_codon:yes stop_codon:yes gene_type:complete